MNNEKIKQIATNKLERAGLYGRTIARWWAGFYHNHKSPTAIETLSLTRQEISNRVATQSRRG